MEDFGEQQISVNDDFPNTQFFSLTNYPNPFSSSTTISFNLATTCPPTGGKSHENTRIEIYNIKGQKVKTLNIGSVVWDGKNENGNSVSNGIYFYKLTAGNYSKIKKMVLLR